VTTAIGALLIFAVGVVAATSWLRKSRAAEEERARVARMAAQARRAATVRAKVRAWQEAQRNKK
jgi:hypothetical protein